MSVGAVVVRREVVVDVVAPVHACVEYVEVHFVVGEFDEIGVCLSEQELVPAVRCVVVCIEALLEFSTCVAVWWPEVCSQK